MNDRQHRYLRHFVDCQSYEELLDGRYLDENAQLSIHRLIGAILVRFKVRILPHILVFILRNKDDECQRRYFRRLVVNRPRSSGKNSRLDCQSIQLGRYRAAFKQNRNRFDSSLKFNGGEDSGTKCVFDFSKSFLESQGLKIGYFNC